jgi:hypothetical protein
VVSALHPGLDLDVGLEVPAAVQLVEEGLTRLVDRLFLEERARDQAVDVGRVVHALDPPAVAHPGHAGEDGDVVVEARVDDGLQVSLVREVLPDAVGVVEQVPIRDLLAAARLGDLEEVRKLRQLAFELDLPKLHGRVGGGSSWRRGGPPKLRRCPAPYWMLPSKRRCSLNVICCPAARRIAARSTAPRVAQAGGIDETHGGGEVFANVKRADGLPSRARSSGWMSTWSRPRSMSCWTPRA